MKISLKFRKIIVLLVLSSLSMTVMNCSKKDSGSVTPSAQIVGSWKITALLVKEGTNAEADQFPLVVALLPCFKDIVFTFKSSGELTGTVPAACQSTTEDYLGSSGTAKYEVKDGKLNITDTDGTVTSEDVSFSGNQMFWTSSETDAGVVTTTKIVFTKQ
jgi:hypothetical protein